MGRTGEDSTAVVMPRWLATNSRIVAIALSNSIWSFVFEDVVLHSRNTVFGEDTPVGETVIGVRPRRPVGVSNRSHVQEKDGDPRSPGFAVFGEALCLDLCDALMSGG